MTNNERWRQLDDMRARALQIYRRLQAAQMAVDRGEDIRSQVKRVDIELDATKRSMDKLLQDLAMADAAIAAEVSSGVWQPADQEC